MPILTEIEVEGLGIMRQLNRAGFAGGRLV